MATSTNPAAASSDGSREKGEFLENDESLENRFPGAHADTPAQIPRRGWWQIARRAYKEMGNDQMPLMAAGVAFYGFLALVPTLIAATMLYGLVTDPAEVQQQVESFSGVLPASAQDLLATQMTALAASNTRSLGIGLVVALALALWSASGGIGNMITAINAAYDESDDRNIVKRKALALGLTIAAIVFFAIMLSLVAVFPAVADNLDLPGPARAAAEAVRWLLVLLLIAVALGVLYRIAPDRRSARTSWVSVGAVAATILWALAAVGFSLYVDNFASYGKTYGSLAGVVVLLLWLWISCYVVLLGAELNAEAEEQTLSDTTRGPQKPRGERGAVKADNSPADALQGAGGPAGGSQGSSTA